MNVMARLMGALPNLALESLKWLLTHGTRTDGEEDETFEEPPTKRRRKDDTDDELLAIYPKTEVNRGMARMQRILGQDRSDDFLLPNLESRVTCPRIRRKSQLESPSSSPISRSFGTVRASDEKENVILISDDEKSEEKEMGTDLAKSSLSDGNLKLMKDAHTSTSGSSEDVSEKGSWVQARSRSRMMGNEDSMADKENDVQVMKVIAPSALEKRTSPPMVPQNIINVASTLPNHSGPRLDGPSYSLKRPNSGSLSSSSTIRRSSSCTRKLQLLDESIRLDERKKYSELLQNFTHVPVMKLPSRYEMRFRKEFPIPLHVPPARKKVHSDVEVIDLTASSEWQNSGTASVPPLERKDIAALLNPAPSSLLRKKLEQCNVYDVTWVTELTKTYRRKECETQKKILEEKVKAALATKKSEQMLNEILEERVRMHLRLSDVAVEEGPMPVAEDEVSLPELTPEMEKKISYVFKSGPGNEVITEKFNLRITRRDMHTLVGTNWLNDEVINFYMNLLIDRGKLDNYPSVYCFNTFFYPKLASQGHSSLKRWTRRIDIFANDMLMVPVHLGVHWCLACVNLREKKISYYDSMGGSNNTCLQNLMQYLQDESMDKKKTKFNSSGWALENIRDNPQQMNGSDCGMFSCMYAEFLCRKAKINFSQSDMPYFRRKMAYEILTARLLL